MRLHRVLVRPAAATGALLLTAGVLAGVGAASGPAAAIDSDHSHFKAETSPMGQANAPVFAVQVANGTIFAGGKFTSTGPAGVARADLKSGQAYLASFDSKTGAPNTVIRAVLKNNYTNGEATVRALALSPDKRTLYVGGDFNEINGQRAEHVAKFDVATGNFLGQIGVNGVNGNVHSLAVSPDGGTLYVGGRFGKANWGVERNYAAAFNVSSGALTAWKPAIGSPMYSQDHQGLEPISVDSLAVSSDGANVFLGGTFMSINGTPMQGFAATRAADSSLVPGFRADYLVPTTRNWAQGLATKDGKVYLAARGDDGKEEGIIALDEKTGALRWNSGCKGDSMAVLPYMYDVYVASHMYLCAPSQFWATQPLTNHAVHAINAGSGILRPYWMVTNGTTADNETLWMSRALATDGNVLVMGGGFSSANGSSQNNLARFELGSAPPSRAPWPLGYSCDGCDNVRVRVTLAGDRDDVWLTYRIYRNNDTTTPIDTRTVYTTFDVYTQTYDFHDYAPAGSSNYYRVKVTDPAGNETWSVRTPVFTVGKSGSTASTARVAPSGDGRTPSLTPTTDAQKAAVAGQP